MTILEGISIVIGSFISGGTTTPNFMRFAQSPKAGFWIAAIAFFVGNSIMYVIGGVSYIYVGGDDVFDVMSKLGLFYFALIILGINIWTYNNDALYSAGFSLADILEKDKKDIEIVLLEV